MKNNDIRQSAAANGVKLWQIADEIGVADCNFSRKLRHELSPEEKAKIIGIIDRLKAERAKEAS